MSKNKKQASLKQLKNLGKNNKPKKDSDMTKNQITQLTTKEKKAYIKQYPYLDNAEYLLYHNKDNFSDDLTFIRNITIHYPFNKLGKITLKHHKKELIMGQ